MNSEYQMINGIRSELARRRSHDRWELLATAIVAGIAAILLVIWRAL